MCLFSPCSRFPAGMVRAVAVPAVPGVVAREDAWAEMGELKMAHGIIEARLRFIREAAEGRLNIFALTGAELCDSLAKAGFPPSPEDGGGYDYLLTTNVSSMTVDGVQLLERERDETLASMNAAKASAALFAREQLKIRMDALAAKKQRFEGVLSTLASNKEALERTAAELRDEVSMKMLAVEVAVSSREAELLQQVARIEQTKKTQVSETSEDLQTMAKSLTSCIEDVESALAKSDPYDFLEAAAAVEVHRLPNPKSFAPMTMLHHPF